MQINPAQIPADVQQAKLRLGIIGNAPALIAAIRHAIQVAPVDLSVLINGESGTGKEFFPKIIHQYSPRKHSKYIAVNCGAIPEGTIDSELFGHEKGAFTGAISDRKGYFEEADGGTIFLDEVAELPMTTQARLLRVIETGEFMKVGSSTVQRTKVRIIAATNVDMVRAVEAGRFREDLYYRLSTVTIKIPPLRDRGGDIFLLARKFASDFAERYRTPGITLDDSARHLLSAYRWPGNVRQLKNVIEQMALFEAGSSVSAETVEQYIPSGATVYAPTVTGGAGSRSTQGGAYESERDILFNMILRLQGQIDELRSRLEKAERPTIDAQASEVTPPSRSIVKYTPMPGLLGNDNPLRGEALSQTRDDSPDPGGTDARAQGAPSLSLEETEREMIRQALERNMGRRKETARELGISERTLYRKIKEFGLE